MTGLWPRVFSRDTKHSHKLWVFPIAAGFGWFSTLSILIFRWVAIGQPRYPGQVNPDIPFISDIGAFVFQPVFITGCAITGITFAGTVFAIHHVRYSDNFYGLTNDAEWRQITSFVALFAGLISAACLVLLSIFDTFENNDEHRYLLMGTFGGLGTSAILTTAVWWDQIWGPSQFMGLRKWCLFNTFLMFCQTALGFLFVIMMYRGRFRETGILEWILSYTGAFWMASFAGYTGVRDDRISMMAVHRERQPLLG